MPRQRHHYAAAGFTLIEIILVTFISTLVITALLRFLSIGHPLARTTYLQAQSTETARLQLKRLASALREVRTSDAGAFALVETSPQRIIFYADVDGDPAVERVRYELVGTNLHRGVTDPSGTPVVYDTAQEHDSVVTTFIRNGSEPIFLYYDGSYPANPSPLPGTALADITYMQFRLVIDADPMADPPAVDVISQVQLRNLKTNLGET